MIHSPQGIVMNSERIHKYNLFPIEIGITVFNLQIFKFPNFQIIKTYLCTRNELHTQ